MPPLTELPMDKKAKPVPKRKKPGERPFKPTRPIRRVERSYSRHKRDEVVMFLSHYQVFDPSVSQANEQGYRAPSYADAAKHFGIPRTTIARWAKVPRLDEEAKKRVSGAVEPNKNTKGSSGKKRTIGDCSPLHEVKGVEGTDLEHIEPKDYLGDRLVDEAHENEKVESDEEAKESKKAAQEVAQGSDGDSHGAGDNGKDDIDRTADEAKSE
ncbi:hypothetical protein HRG_008110 [Hirsutella rhossiliensis]|uniref:Uncharacterized protein n=1 Tax=Hirsutella rhossiliensis TaxID=111463 RepID=A0A9P8MXG7_9HYPO|nr:uncharacterized protein HRG_08110 [Hirsutella rhossiliensis]KAH0960957.1 hypothetical protein HRG_08110 [Hirsutella rhossiliensis]